MHEVAVFGQGKDPVFLADLGCTGTESNLLECPNTPFVGTYCTHGRDVGVRCEGQLLMSRCCKFQNGCYHVVEKYNIGPLSLCFDLV